MSLERRASDTGAWGGRSLSKKKKTAWTPDRPRMEATGQQALDTYIELVISTLVPYSKYRPVTKNH